MVHRHTAPALLTALVLGGGSIFAVAQMGPDDDRRLPYQGTLESAGAPAVSGLYTLRFGLFLDRTSDAACLVSDPAGCTLWGEEQTVSVVEGRFSVALGDEAGIPDSVLAQPALFLSIAVSGPDDGDAFTLLDTKQEILSVPFAARAAAARDYKVTGTLSADTVIATTGVIDTVESDNVLVNGISLRANGDGVQFRAASNPPSGDALLTVRSANGAERLRVEHDGEVSIDNDIRVDGNAVVTGNTTISGNTVITGALEYECATGWNRVGAWCIEDRLRGAVGGSSYPSVLSTCHTLGANICPIDALLACDTIAPGGAECTAVTDSDQWLWTSGINATDDANAFSNMRLFNGNGNNSSNEADIAVSTETTFAGGGSIRAFCCRPGGGR